MKVIKVSTDRSLEDSVTEKLEALIIELGALLIRDGAGAVTHRQKVEICANRNDIDSLEERDEIWDILLGIST